MKTFLFLSQWVPCRSHLIFLPANKETQRSQQGTTSHADTNEQYHPSVLAIAIGMAVAVMVGTMLGEAPQQRRADGTRNDVAHSTEEGQDAVDGLGALFAKS